MLLRMLATQSCYEKIDIANLEMPMSRPRVFFAFIRDDVDWSLTEFKQNMHALAKAEREADFELGSNADQEQSPNAQVQGFEVATG